MIRLTLCSLLMLLAAHAHAEAAPDWSLPTLQGHQQLKLSDLRGKIVLMDFWASWCVPCRPAMQALQQLQQDYADVVVVPISVDEDAEDARDFVNKYGPQLRSLHDAEGEVAEAYDLLGMPSSFVIAPDGQIALRHEGYRKGDEQHWREAIDRLREASTLRSAAFQTR